MNNNIYPNLNNSSYYINHLSSPEIPTWHTSGRPIRQTIKHFGINKHHRRTVQRMCKMVNPCIENGVHHKGKKNSKHTGT